MSGHLTFNIILQPELHTAAHNSNTVSQK